LRGTKPTEEEVDDIGKYFPFENREGPLRTLYAHLLYYLKEWIPSFRCKPDSNKSYLFAVCHGIAGIGKTTFITDGFFHLVNKLMVMAPPPKNAYS
jgi:hypothetical protein